MRKTIAPPSSRPTARRISDARRDVRPSRHLCARAVELLEQRTFLSAVQLAAGLPDLIITDVNAPSSGSVGGSVLVAWTVKNIDPANAATARWSDGVYLSTDGTLDADDVRIQLVSARSRSPLAAGASYTVNQNVIIPGDTPAGTYHLIVQTDDLGDQQAEADESNNWLAAANTLTLGEPDLAISAVTYPATAIPGTSLSFSFTVANHSTTYDAAAFWTDSAVLSGDDVFGNGDDIVLGEWANPSALAPGASYVSSQTVTVPDGGSSANYLLIKTDNNLLQGETDETNNVSASSIQTRPLVSVGDTTLAEGQSGTTSATFAVTLDVASPQTVSVNWSTADGTASGGTDFVAAGGTVTFGPGQTSRAITVLVNGDKLREPDETFSVNLSGAVNAGVGDSEGIATVTNDDAIPTAFPDAYAVDSSSVLNVAAPGVLSNDTDANGDALTAVLNAGPSHGSVALNANGSFTYTPTIGYAGGDSFTYHATDSANDSNLATVSITVNNVNHPPASANDAYTIAEDQTLTVASPGVLANDHDADGNPVSAVLVTGPTSGTLTLGATGGFVYTPGLNFNGADSFTYRANDGSASGNVATGTITVSPVNDTPVANNDAYSVNEDVVLNVAAPGVLSNDPDVEGDSLSTLLVTGPAHGSLTLNANGSFTYAPAANYNGADFFTYRALDASAGSNVATVNLTINSVNDAPVATLGPDSPGVGGPVTPGGTYYWFRVSYTDDGAVDWRTIGGTDVQVSGPGAYSQLGTVSNLVAAGTGFQVTYRVTAPGGTWNAQDNGTYTISLRAGEVSDTAGLAAPAATLGTLAVNIPDLSPPTATLSAPDITAPGGVYYWFTVSYADDTAVDWRTIGGGDVLVTGPGGYSQAGTLSNLVAAGTGWQATYRVPAPGGTWDAPDNGTYAVNLRASEVADTAGKFAPAAVLGVFHASFADAVAPTAALNASNVTAGGGTYYWFQVAYSDNASVSWSTIGSGDVEVSGPNGFVQSGVLSNLTTSGGIWTATYRITAPGGTFGAEDNGAYTVTMRPGQVSDTFGNSVAAGPLGAGFQVNIAPPVAPASAAVASPSPFSEVVISPLRRTTAARSAYGLSDLLA